MHGVRRGLARGLCLVLGTVLPFALACQIPRAPVIPEQLPPAAPLPPSEVAGHLHAPDFGKHVVVFGHPQAPFRRPHCFRDRSGPADRFSLRVYAAGFAALLGSKTELHLQLHGDLLRAAEGGGLEPRAARAARIAFQASPVPDGCTFQLGQDGTIRPRSEAE